VMIDRAATMAARITGCWKMRGMLRQLVKEGRVPRQKSAIPTCSFDFWGLWGFAHGELGRVPYIQRASSNPCRLPFANW
jgi:hypothetical protein